ncbi:hypothetical protein T484DRAFT_1854321 [Baffinella frigidus]|nr:hypothetical protein T484DRAFT_1854321 [Cryptophyta sp. CCMP2293]
MVVNYDMPNQIEDYVHRIGRTGRAGNSGHATAFITEKDSRLAKDLERILVEARQESGKDLERIFDKARQEVAKARQETHNLKEDHLGT